MNFKVLYVDTISEPQAQINVEGISSAYNKIVKLIKFDYRKIAKYFGKQIMNTSLYIVAKITRPNLIHIGKGETIQGDTIKIIKKNSKCKVIHFYGDFRNTPQPYVIDIGKYADITLLYHKDQRIIKQHHDLGVKNIGFWWVGSDPDIYRPIQLEKKYDVVFFGNNADFLPGHEERRNLIKAIAESGITIHIFGNNWDLFTDHQNIVLHNFVVSKEFVDTCSKAKITLGYNAVNDVYYYASWRRPFNCMACGAFHLTKYFPGIEEVFETKKHLVWFDTINEAVELIHFYLNNSEERENIAQNGREEIINNHTWDKRIEEMINIYKSIGGEIK
ncbi:MAG: glycosyltransferase [Spirochaetota bacterium]|nr:glycosyltransferase [Spirochaetota bacterium]